jgi:hypothetical protein
MATDFIVKNYTWIFSGIGVAIISAIISFVFWRQKQHHTSNTVSQQVNVNIDHNLESSNGKKIGSIEATKTSKRILFVDDDVKFKIVKILKNAGWVNTTIVKDIRSLDSSDVINADLFFIDVNGVGKLLDFKDEGLGLAKALKEKYPNKGVVIYSSDKTGDRFHESLRKADDFLSKDAEPYQFQKIVEKLLSRG